MQNLGDFVVNAPVDFLWPTQLADGSSTTPTGGTIKVYKNNSATESTTGVTDDRTWDSMTGVHHCRIATSADGTFYAAGSEFTVVLVGATIDSKSVNTPLAHFSIQRANTRAVDILDVAAGVESNLTVREFLRLAAASLFAKLSGAATSTVTIRDYNDTKNRIQATVDSDGNRSAFTYDKS